MLNPKLENRFSYHPTNPVLIPKFNAIRDKFQELVALVDDLCPESVEKSIAITKLDEANLFAIQAIVRHE